MYTNENQFKIYSKKWLDQSGIPASSHCLEGKKITLPLEIYVTLNVSMCACKSSCINQHTWHKKVLSQEKKKSTKTILEKHIHGSVYWSYQKGHFKGWENTKNICYSCRGPIFFSGFHNRQVTTTVTPAPGESSTLLWLLLETTLTCTHRQTHTVNTYKK